MEVINKVSKPSKDDILHIEVARRVISNYRIQKGEGNVPKVYEPGPTWQDVYQNSGYVSPSRVVTDEELAEALFAGFRNGGLEGDSNYFLKDLYFSRNSDMRTLAYTIVKAYNYTKKTVPAQLLEKPMSLIGQPIFITYKNLKINTNHLIRIHCLQRLLTLTDLKKEQSFVWCDLGSGTGTMARMIKETFPKATIILVDLPETLLFASYFLSMNFPNARIGYYDELKTYKSITTDVISRYDVIFLPHFAYERLDANTVDISWNTGSLSEMTIEAIQNYIRIIERTSRSGGYFYCVNRNIEVQNRGAIDVPLHRFPFADGCWDVVSQRRSDKSLDLFFESRAYMGELFIRKR